MSDRRIIIGCRAYYEILGRDSASEYFDTTDIKHVAAQLQQEMSRENRTGVRAFADEQGDMTLLPIASIVRCIVRPVYKTRPDAGGGEEYVLRSEEEAS